MDFGLRRQDEVCAALKNLYKSYGYREYRLSSFEEYSLYSENRNFLTGGEIITFSSGGKLMALRPDVTLSVVKNFRNTQGVQKLFYDEKVYRPDMQGIIAESNQIGVEILGEVDAVAEAEAVELSLKTLFSLGGEVALDLSHIGLTGKILDRIGLHGADRAFALSCLAEKNAHDFLKFALSRGISREKADILIKLISLPADPESALKIMKNLGVDGVEGEIAEIESVLSLTENSEKINVDFSITGNADYYNGLIFKGYVKGAPRAVLSGGRYDNLVRKFDGDRQAIGFALYLGELDGLFAGGDEPCDEVLTYGDDGRAAIEKARALRSAGKRVLLVPRGKGGSKC